MILKWIIFGIIIYAVYTLFFKNRGISSNSKQRRGDEDSNDSEEMVECCECGTFVSTKDAFIKSGKFYCSKECLNKG